MKSVLKFVLMSVLTFQLYGLRTAQAEEVLSINSAREYGVTPFSALMLLETLDQFPKLAGYNFKLAIDCSDYDLRSIRQQLLRGYFRSSFQEVDGKIIHVSPIYETGDTVEITRGVTGCLRALVDVAYAYEIKDFQFETTRVKKILGLYESYISLCDSFDEELKADLSEKAMMFNELRPVLSRQLQFHLTEYLISLHKRHVIYSTMSSKK